MSPNATPQNPQQVKQALFLDFDGALGEDFRVQWGKAVAEMLPVGFHKGGAIDVLMELPPFAGRTLTVFGDDVTDADAFRLVNARALLMRWSREWPVDAVAELKRL
jgi:trehalose-phosphatase